MHKLFVMRTVFIFGHQGDNELAYLCKQYSVQDLTDFETRKTKEMSRLHSYCSLKQNFIVV